ncbi:hypothetical protein Neosp_012312 [[Neocosmospora] mangrovei]
MSFTPNHDPAPDACAYGGRRAGGGFGGGGFGGGGFGRSAPQGAKYSNQSQALSGQQLQPQQQQQQPSGQPAQKPGPREEAEEKIEYWRPEGRSKPQRFLHWLDHENCIYLTGLP